MIRLLQANEILINFNLRVNLSFLKIYIEGH